MTERLVVFGTEPQRVARVAARVGAPIDDDPTALTVLVDADRIALRPPGRSLADAITVDFTAAGLAQRALGGRRALLARALGLDRGTRSIVDATAGLGRDAYVLAAAGAHVTMCERHPVLALLLEDGLRRARAADIEAVARLRLVEGDARELLAGLAADQRPDAVLVDPMYPATGKAALPGKALQLLRALLGPGGDDVEAVVAIARAVVRRRVVVKRSPHAPSIGGRPAATFAGSRVRYDVFTPRPA